MTFWDHLDELRGTLLRCLAVTLMATVAAFCLKDPLFEIYLAPGSDSFVSYRFLSGLVGDTMPAFHVDLINTGLAGQFMVHLRGALCAGVLVTSPYILYCLFMFISPGLYRSERRAAVMALLPGYLMFIVGVMVSYFIIFPLTFRFLGTYQVASQVTNIISVESYMSTLIVLSLAMGVVFELPVVSAVLARTGLLTSAPMRRYRRHAIVVILIAAAVITPTSDIFTLLAVALPIYLLYEASILIVALIRRRNRAED